MTVSELKEALDRVAKDDMDVYILKDRAWLNVSDIVVDKDEGVTDYCVILVPELGS